MADQDAPPQIEDEDAVPSLFDHPDGVDWFLAQQVHQAEGYQIQQGITLNVGGVLVAGTLIGGRDYLQGLSEYMKIKTKGTPSEEWGEILGDNVKMLVDIYPARQGDEDYPYRPYTYIHLKDARVIGSGGYISAAEGGYWRGKLTAVDGFFFGEMSVGK